MLRDTVSRQGMSPERTKCGGLLHGLFGQVECGLVELIG